MTAYGILSTYPPTPCGLATFSESLLRHLTTAEAGDQAGVVQVLDAPPTGFHPEVVAHLVNGSAGGPAVAAAALNGFEVAVVQHEYGIYGGRDGENVLAVLADLEVPSIVVLHTVLVRPSAHQRQVLERIVQAADVAVVMSRAAAHRLKELYLVDADKVVVIPHGALGRRSTAPTPSITPFAAVAAKPARPTILTWGLIGPGKGIEWGIDALADLADLPTPPRYLVAGRTHPKVLSREGDAYRDSLRARAVDRGVADLVEFDADYRNPEALMALVREADVVLLPYDSSEQVTSGVLTEAVVARRPVVATDFPHAAELLADGAGIVVPHRDPAAISAALRRVLTEKGLSADMSARAALIAPDLEWSAVAQQYRALAGQLLGRRAKANV